MIPRDHHEPPTRRLVVDTIMATMTTSRLAPHEPPSKVYTSEQVEACHQAPSAQWVATAERERSDPLLNALSMISDVGGRYSYRVIDIAQGDFSK